MQDFLFPDDEDDDAPPPAAVSETPSRPKRGAAIEPAPVEPELHALAAALPPALRLGTSSWTYPGWRGLVWAHEHSEAILSKRGLAAYARHPLLRTVSIDRVFYRPLSAAQYAAYAAQVPDDFRFVVKAPSLVTDALVRDEDGRAQRPNDSFLDAEIALKGLVEPALEGLGAKLGALVFQLSPLPDTSPARMAMLVERLHAMLKALPGLRPAAPDGVLAVEVRDGEWLTPDFAAALRDAGATYCLGLHPKLPPLAAQLPVLRALWPGPLVCRWNLHPLFGPYGYEEAERRYRPYDALHDPDPQTHAALARVVAGTLQGGQPAFVTLSNHAEGSAPRSVARLAQAVRDRLEGRAP